jgi:hypothetical protein
LSKLAVPEALDALGAALLSTDPEDPSDAVEPRSPLTCGTTTSDDATDPAGSTPAALDPVDALATVVVEEDVLERCKAARTDEGDRGGGRWAVTEFETDRTPCSPSTRASNVAIAQPPTRSPLRRIRSSMVDAGLKQHKPALIHD